MLILVTIALLALAHQPALAYDWRCAGVTPGEGEPSPAAHWPAAAKTVARVPDGGRGVVLFAGFKNEHVPGAPLPAWADKLFDPDFPGSITHYYHTMSFGRLRLGADVAPRRYTSRAGASDYLVDGSNSTDSGGYGAFVQEVLEQADGDLDFSHYDSDGPDGVPNSGDDDGVVDVIFLVLTSTPKHFIVPGGSATGVARLGFGDDYITDDPGANGEPIRISPNAGTVQQGRDYAETVGTICHEYGHVLGLPDLYNFDFLKLDVAGPQQDSAGIGRWGLMGWGALGWRGDDGPASMCAWSRDQLGWVQVAVPGSSQETMVLEDVGREGAVYRIPLNQSEYFLVEYRTRASSHYDRNIPGEGLLVWHVDRPSWLEEGAGGWRVDLECADGRWREAGYPRGVSADPKGGEDNLDFWAHDATYRDAHGGNLGDATDPFDGVRYRAFTDQTNPTSLSQAGLARVHLEKIRLRNGVATAEVMVQAPDLELTSVAPGAYGVVAGGAVPVPYAAANRGGLPITDLVLRLRSDDPLVEIVDEEMALADLDLGQEAAGNWLSAAGFPRVRIRPGFKGEHSTSIILEASALGQVLDVVVIDLLAIPGYRVSGVVRDEEGPSLEGVPVEAARQTGSGPRVTAYYRERVTTDSEGRYELYVPEGVYSVSARPAASTGYAGGIQTPLSVATDVSLDLRVAKYGLVRGQVWDPAGAPVPLLGIMATARDRAYSDFDRSGADGAYRLRLVPGIYSIETSSWRLPRGIPRQGLAEIEVTGGMVLDLYPQTRATLTLQVVDEEGKGVPDIQLTLAGDPEDAPLSALTGEDGRGVLQVLSDAYSMGVGQVPLPYLPTLSTRLDVVSDTTIQVILRLGALVSGRLLDEAGMGAGSGGGALEFVLVDAGTAISHHAPVADESFAVGLAPGLYHVSYQGDDLHPTQDLGMLQVSQDLQVDFVLRKEPSASTDIAGEGAPQPHTFGLAQNYPNPFNSQTIISYRLARAGEVRLSVYSATGQLVRSLIADWQQAGEHSSRWNGRDGGGAPVASGVYLYALEAGGEREMRRLLLLLAGRLLLAAAGRDPTAAATDS